MKKYLFLMGLALIAGAILLAGCSSTEPKPTDEHITLGTEYEALTKAWGEPNHEIVKITDGHGLVNFKDDYYLAYIQEGRLASIIVQFETSGGNVTQEVAEGVAKVFLPGDADQVTDYEIDMPPGSSKVLVYKSETLASKFEPDKFVNADGDNEAGLCIVKYNFNEQGEVFRLLVAIGNNP